MDTNTNTNANANNNITNVLQDAKSSTSSMNEVDRTFLKQNSHLALHKREPSHRVFVNRSLQLSKIRFFGFDMDYTLAVYKSPQYEQLAFRLVVEHLLKLGYPKEIKDFEYDPSFPVRGLWYDKIYGHLLKVDTYGNVLTCVHGFKFLSSHEIRKYYPNKYINYDESRIYIFNTLFNLPEIYLLACLINYFALSPNYEHNETGVKSGTIFITFKAIYQDVRLAVDYIHEGGTLKKLTVEDMENYVIKDNRLPLLLNRMHDNNAKVFLLTNSGYEYTDKIMTYMLNDHDKSRNWRTYFDYIVVDAVKPLFFEEGTSLKEICIETGSKNFGSHSGPLLKNQVYSGGSCDVFSKLIGARGKDVLYIGDHIFGDIIKSKKQRAWRTFLVVPELAQELTIWHEKRDLFNTIEELDSVLSEILINFDSTAKSCPDVSNIKTKMVKAIHEMDMQYGLLGSLFRSGSRQTYLASQITRYADVYAASHLNLLHYPFFYLFKAPPMLMPHESTVNPHEGIKEENIIKRKPTFNSVNSSTSSSRLQLNEASDDVMTKSLSLSKDTLVEAAENAIASDITSLKSDNSVKSTESNANDAENNNSDVFQFSYQQYDQQTGKMQRTMSVVKPDAPSSITHYNDFDDDDEDEDSV